MARRAALGGVLASLVVAGAFAGPVEVYRTGPQFCPHDRDATAPPLTEAQAIERARALLPVNFCVNNAFADGCEGQAEFVYGAWRVFVRQYRVTGGQRDYAGLEHSYVVLDAVGNCLANIPGTELGARN